MKKQTVIDLWNVIMRVEEFKSNIKVSYFVAKNKMLLKSHVESIAKLQTPDKDFQEFEYKRSLLIQRYSEKDRNGKSQYCSQSKQYVITVNREQFEDEVAKLRESYKDALEKRDKQMTSYFQVLTEDISLDLVKIKLSELPQEIEPVILNIFMEADLIQEDNSEEENN